MDLKRIIILILAILLMPIWTYADEPDSLSTENNKTEELEKEETSKASDNIEQNSLQESVIINQYTGLQEVIIIDDYTEEPTTDSVPMRPLNLRYTSVTTDSVSIVWDENMGYDEVTSYNIYVNGTKVGSTKTSSYVIENLFPGRKYEITITALNYFGESLESTPIEVITNRIPITTPNNIKVINVTENTAIISWENTSSKEVLYNLYLNGSFVGSTTNTYYQFDNLTSNSDYNIGIEPDGNPELLTLVSLRTGDVIDQETISEIVRTGFEYIRAWWPYLAVILGLVLSFAIIRMMLDVFANFDIG